MANSLDTLRTAHTRSMCPRLSIFALVIFAVVLADCFDSNTAPAQELWREQFEGPTTSWHPAGGDARYRLLEHRRVQDVAKTGNSSEWIRLVGEGGTTAYFAHPVGKPRVIPDLAPSLWVRSDRPGLQLAARIVLPRTTDPRTGQPMSILLTGPGYAEVGRWQQLRLDDLWLALNRHIRVLRTQLGPQVDGREAYLAELLLNVYGGPGETNVWIDDLEIAGYAVVSVAGQQDSAAAVPAHTLPTDTGVPPAAAAPHRQSQQQAQPHQRAAVFDGSILLIQGKPVFPRLIQYRGEPLPLIKQLGFTGVWLDGPPTSELLAEAKQLGLWVICPPPRPPAFDLPDEHLAALTEIGSQYDAVLAWDLGRRLNHQHTDATRRWAQHIRLADRQGRRPTICQPLADLQAYSRTCDLVLMDRRPLGTSMPLAEYPRWLRDQLRLARPGTTFWTTLQSQPSPALRAQLAAIDATVPLPATVPEEQIRLQALTAIAAGSRGLLVLSETPLSADDPQTRRRAMALELLNLELSLIEPWAAAGSYLSEAESSIPEVSVSVLRVDRARLAIPAWLAPEGQYATPQAAATSLSLVVPGAPESSSAYWLSPGGVQPLRHKRATGGIRVTIEPFTLGGFVVLGHDPLVIDSVSRRAVAIGPRAAQLHRALVVARYNAVLAASEQWHRYADVRQKSIEALQAARDSLRECDARLAANDYTTACRYAEQAAAYLRAVERWCWEKTASGLPWPVSSPATTGFAALTWHGRLAQQLTGMRLGQNLLPGGDFEDFHLLTASGWQHFQFTIAGVKSDAQLTPDAAHSGRQGLRLWAWSDQPPGQPLATAKPQTPAPPAALDSPPLWVATPPIPIQAGQVVRIHGWVNIPQPIAASVDGLMIVDSLAGDDLALRVNKTAGWQQFTIYRVAPQSGTVNVSFVLTGLGAAYIDNVTIALFEPAGR